jgi:predicted metal-binding membrane protein
MRRIWDDDPANPQLPGIREAGPALPLIAVGAACWVVTANRMDGMDMGPGTELGGLGWFVGVWATMMAAMMLPSLVPMGATYVRAGNAGRGSGEARPFVATVAFAPVTCSHGSSPAWRPMH